MHAFLRSLRRSLPTIFGLVLVWRGVWNILDGIDKWVFGSNHIFSTIASIIAGILILYIPDKDLKEIEKL